MKPPLWSVLFLFLLCAINAIEAIYGDLALWMHVFSATAAFACGGMGLYLIWLRCRSTTP